MPPKPVYVHGVSLPAPVLVDVDGPWRIFAAGDATGLVNLGQGRKATVIITLAELADLLMAVPGEAVKEDDMETVIKAAKILKEAG